MRWYIIVVGLLHVAFMVCEMYPWPNPILLGIVTKELPAMADIEGVTNPKFSPQQQQIVATIVHNAGIYNAILAAGLFWAAFRGKPANEIAFLLFIGAAVAGGFGTATLMSPVTALQGLMGIIGSILIKRNSLNEVT
jgi:uncharacterized membrane protein